MTEPVAMVSDPDWWRGAVIYQVYIRSFADGTGDGLGDIAGLRARLDHIAELGVDAIWINPWYPSPMADAGYDVITYLDVEPRFGALADAEALIDAAHDHGLRVLLDIVPNHTSNQHPWFREALAGGPGSPMRDRFIFRDGRGTGGELAPNDWRSAFGGPAWTRVVEPDGRGGQWYLHLFAPEQPDRNWEHADVVADLEDALRFWFDRGVDGFRIDVAHSLFKDPALPDLGGSRWPDNAVGHPHWDLDPVHDIYRAWRTLADSYDPPRVFVAEAWVPDPQRLTRYVRSDELHTTFNFDFLRCPWHADALRRVIDVTLREHEAVGAPATWVLSNHDTARHVSRYARPEQRAAHHLSHLSADFDLALGIRRARAATLLMLALPGSCYLYQGEELGLPEVEDLPDDALQDPTWLRSGRRDRGRDGCRVPLPWSGTRPPFGFSADGVTTWLPQPPSFAAYTVEAELDDPRSMLRLYRSALRMRRELPALGDGALRWTPSPPEVLAFEREPGFTCLVNVSAQPCAVPADHRVVLCSEPFTTTGLLPPDAAVWLQR